MDRILERLQKIQRESKFTVWVSKDIYKQEGNTAVDTTIFDKDTKNPRVFRFYSFNSEQENEETFKKMEDYLHDCEAKI